MVDFTQDIHLPFGIAAGFAQLVPQVGLQRQRIEHGVVQPVVQQLVQQNRVLAEELRRPAAGMHHADHARQRVRIFGQQRQVG